MFRLRQKKKQSTDVCKLGTYSLLIIHIYNLTTRRLDSNVIEIQ